MIKQTKLEINDFSGGITENFIPGKPNMYQRADNLWVTKSLDLQTRPGSRLLEGNGAQVPTGGSRINELFPFNGESELLAVSTSNLFYQDETDTWTKVTGPSGNSAFVGTTNSGHVAHAEWRGQVFMTPDGSGSPQKAYRDDTGTLRLRQAGLPKPTITPSLSTTQKFNACVNMALTLRSNMIAHFSDSGPLNTGQAHVTVQNLTTLNALTTPTTLAQLVTYITTLRSEYLTHVNDALLFNQPGVSAPQVYHINAQSDTFLFPGFIDHTGVYSVLNLTPDATLNAITSTNTDATLADIETQNNCIKALNDLRNKYNWHTYATSTHGNAWIPNQYNSWWDTFMTPVGWITLPRNTAGFGKNACPLPMIETSEGLTSSNNYAYFIQYVNALKREFYLHCTNYGSFQIFGAALRHMSIDYENVPFLPDATDLHSAITILAHLEYQYCWHYFDAQFFFNSNSTPQYYKTFTGTTTIGSGTFTSTSIDGSGYTFSGTPFKYYVVPISGFTSSFSGWFNTVVMGYTPRISVKGGTANTVITEGTALAAATSPTYTFVVSTSRMHYDIDRNLGSVTSPSAYRQRLSALDYSMKSLDTFITETQVLLGLFKSHETSGKVPVTTPNPDFANGVTTWLEMAQGTQSITPYVFAPHFGSLTFPQSSTYSGIPNGIRYDYFDTIPASSTVLYTLMYRYPYKVGQVDFLDISAPAIATQVLRINSPNATPPVIGLQFPTTVNNIPVLTNTELTNYDTSAVVVDIYRTIGNGGTYYKVGQVNNGVTTFVDNVSDTTLITNEQLYTTGGVVGNDPPPQARFITILNNTAYYGYVTDAGQTFPYRVRQSIQNDPDSCPATFYDDLDDELTGLSNYRSYVIALCKSSIYRLENGFNELGQGFISHERLTDTVGCVGHNSVVRTEFGVFFCGTNGIYWTDGYTFKRVTMELENTYNALIATEEQRARINATYLEDTRRIIWSFMSDPSIDDCDLTWTLDLNFGITETSTFTTISGGASYRPSAMTWFQSNWIRGDSRGYIFRHQEQWKSDPTVDLAVSPANWKMQPIIHDFISSATNFGTNKYKKWATRITVQAENQSNISLSIQHKNDYNYAGFTEVVPIRFRKNVLWGDPALRWGRNDCLWGFDGMIDDFRRFGAGSLRCDWKQIRITNADVIICNSDTYGVAGTSADVGGVVTATISTLYKWPRQAPGNYHIFFESAPGSGLYLVGYPILTTVDQTLTLDNQSGTAPVSQAGLKWIIKGIPVDDRLNLVAYNITYAPLSDEQRAYHGATSVDGGANK